MTFIDKILNVYLIGSENDYYRLHLADNSGNALRVDLNKGLKGNFLKQEESTINIGKKTKIVSPIEALKLLYEFKNRGNNSPNPETFEKTLQLLKESDLKKKQTIKEETFLSWLVKQNDRDDLIGDVAYDLTKEPELNNYQTYKAIYDLISNNPNFLRQQWDINCFDDNEKKGTVNPLLVLQLAQMEYEIYRKKNLLKKFAVRDPSGVVYFFRQENQKGPIKIGRAKDINRRKKQLQTSLPHNLVTIGFIETPNYFELEKKIHAIFVSSCINREWFELSEQKVINIINKFNGIVTLT